MDEELKNLFFEAIEHFPLERQGAAQRWLKERVVLAKVAEQLISDAEAELPPELQQA
jgi:tRNA U34 5-methylaminomethyl-2-thiouridine-forming methyltransferase MnmC